MLFSKAKLVKIRQVFQEFFCLLRNIRRVRYSSLGLHIGEHDRKKKHKSGPAEVPVKKGGLFGTFCKNNLDVGASGEKLLLVECNSFVSSLIKSHSRIASRFAIGEKILWFLF